MNSQYHKVIVIILAGGQSQRAETIKGLRQVNGEYWIDHQINYFKNSEIGQIFVGLGYNHKEYLNNSKLINTITPVLNTAPQNGSFSTLQNTLKLSFSHQWNQAILMHVDHALPQLSTLSKLINSQYQVIKPVYQNKSGHPIVLSRPFCKSLIQKPYSSQLNMAIRELERSQILWANVKDANVLSNFNTQDKWLEYARTFKT
ncbi:MAG: NTP transferase domain-containing protein [Marinicellaceae bacterium]